MAAGLLVALSVAAGCSDSGSDSSDDGASTAPPPPTKAELAAFADELRTNTEADGGIVAFSQGDAPPIVMTTGVSDARTGQAINPTDAFHVASITKSYVAATVLLLTDRGELDLDDTIDEWVDWPGGDEITVRQLLHHDSGVPPFGNAGDTTNLYDDLFIDTTHAYTIEEVLDATRDLPPAGEPGEVTVYSNLNYILAAAIVEQVTGDMIGDVLADEVFRPLSLDDTWYPPNGPTGPPALPGLVFVDKGVPLLHTDDLGMISTETLTSGAAAAVSTVDDLLDWSRAVFHDQRIGGVDVAAMTDIDPGGYGFGVPGVTPTGACVFDGCPRDARFTRLALNGDINGSSTRLLYDPETDTTLFVYLNRNALSLDDPMIAFLEQLG